jgi:hypothetical protein
MNNAQTPEQGQAQLNQQIKPNLARLKRLALAAQSYAKLDRCITSTTRKYITRVACIEANADDHPAACRHRFFVVAISMQLWLLCAGPQLLDLTNSEFLGFHRRLLRAEQHNHTGPCI